MLSVWKRARGREKTKRGRESREEGTKTEKTIRPSRAERSRRMRRDGVAEEKRRESKEKDQSE